MNNRISFPIGYYFLFWILKCEILLIYEKQLINRINYYFINIFTKKYVFEIRKIKKLANQKKDIL